MITQLLCEMCNEPVDNEDSCLCNACIVVFMMYHELHEKMSVN